MCQAFGLPQEPLEARYYLLPSPCGSVSTRGWVQASGYILPRRILDTSTECKQGESTTPGRARALCSLGILFGHFSKRLEILALASWNFP